MLEVTEVKVSIKQSGSTLVERAGSKSANGLDWAYETTQANASFSGSIITFTAKAPAWEQRCYGSNYLN